jgi:NitT/TauT family transport system substrate-binding protein
MAIRQTRRGFLTTMSAAGALRVFSAPRVLAAEGPLETTSVRFLFKSSLICSAAPQYAAEELLRAEGFKEIAYVEVPRTEMPQAFSDGRVDFTVTFAVNHIQAIDQGAPITILAGVHAGCYELFAHEALGSITELKGKQVGLHAGSPALLKLMTAQVGLDPERDFQWVIDPKLKPLDLFADGKIDAFLGFPPEPQELRARHAGHVILDTTVDRPWSQYFCCMLGGNRDFVRKHPIATRRVVRAILKATDLCAEEPERVAQNISNRGLIGRYDYDRQALSEMPYYKWREYNAEDTVRFYSLRLHEAGLIKATPTKIMAENADWHFFDELKRELKA